MLYYDAFLRFCRANFCKGAIVCFLNDAQVHKRGHFSAGHPGSGRTGSGHPGHSGRSDSDRSDSSHSGYSARYALILSIIAMVSS